MYDLLAFAASNREGTLAASEGLTPGRDMPRVPEIAERKRANPRAHSGVERKKRAEIARPWT